MRKYVKFIILIAIAVLIIWFFTRNLDLAEVGTSLRRADPLYLTFATLIICLGYLLRAIRWKVLLEPITPSSLKELFATTTVGFAAIYIVGRAGEIVRPMWLPMRDPRVRPSAALVTLGMERIFDLAALVCFFAANLLFFKPPPGREADFEYVAIIGYLMFIAVIIGFIALIVYQRLSARIIEITDRKLSQSFVPARLSQAIVGILRQLSSALGVLQNPRECLLVIFWTFLLWLSISIPTWLVLLAFNIPISFSDSLFVMGIAAISSIVPTPGGAAGAFHAATAASLVFLKPETRHEDAAAMSIAMNLVYFAPALIFGLYYFLHGDISIKRFRSLLSSENAVEEIESDSPNRDK